MTVTLTGNEILYVQGIAQNGMPAATTEQTTTGAIAALASSLGGDVNTNITTVGNGTLTAAALVGGLINRTGPTAVYTDTTATAAQIYAAVGSITGHSFYVTIKNGVAFNQTISAGSGVTLPASVIIPPNSAGTYLVLVVSSTAVTFYHVSTVLLTDNALEVITTLSTVGAGTITAAGIAGGVTSRTGAQSGTPFTDTTDTATNIIAAQPNAHIGLSWEYTYYNKTNAVATLTGGTGVTVSAITIVPANGAARYLVTYTAASTITIAGIATMGFSVDATDATKIIGFKASGMTTGKTTLIAAVNSSDATYTLPAATDSLAGIATAQTWTAIQTITNSDLKLLGSSTGANTFTALNSSATNYTTSFPAVTGVLATTTGANLFYADITKCSGSVTANGTTTYANVTGLSQTVVPGTYQFVCRLPSTVASGTGGIKYAFNYTTTVLTSIEATGRGFTASAVAVQHTTTTTTQTDLFTQAAVVIYTELTGTMVVSTGGTIDLQMAQNTSNGSNTITLLGSSMEFVRIA